MVGGGDAGGHDPTFMYEVLESLAQVKMVVPG